MYELKEPFSKRLTVIFELACECNTRSLLQGASIPGPVGFLFWSHRIFRLKNFPFVEDEK